jgi:hypothetical protein
MHLGAFRSQGLPRKYAPMNASTQFAAVTRATKPRCQITIALNEGLRCALETRAREECRTVSGMAHFLLVRGLATEQRKGGMA